MALFLKHLNELETTGYYKQTSKKQRELDGKVVTSKMEITIQ